MKRFVWILTTWWLALAPSLSAETLGELLRAIQSRQRLKSELRQRVTPKLEKKLAELREVTPDPKWTVEESKPLELIDWVGIEENPNDPSSPSDQTIDGLPAAKRLALVNQAIALLGRSGPDPYGPVGYEEMEATILDLCRRVDVKMRISWPVINGSRGGAEFGNEWEDFEPTEEEPYPDLHSIASSTDSVNMKESGLSDDANYTISSFSSESAGFGAYEYPEGGRGIARSNASDMPELTFGPESVNGKFASYSFATPDATGGINLRDLNGQSVEGSHMGIRYFETDLASGERSLSLPRILHGTWNSVSVNCGWSEPSDTGPFGMFEVHHYPKITTQPNVVLDDIFDSYYESRGTWMLWQPTVQASHVFEPNFPSILRAGKQRLAGPVFQISPEYAGIKLVVDESCTLRLGGTRAGISVIEPNTRDWEIIHSGAEDDLDTEITWPHEWQKPYRTWLNFLDYNSAWRSPVFCQLVSDNAGIDVTWISNSKYQVDCYLRESVGPKDTQTGRYAFNGSPVKSFVVEFNQSDLSIPSSNWSYKITEKVQGEPGERVFEVSWADTYEPDGHWSDLAAGNQEEEEEEDPLAQYQAFEQAINSRTPLTTTFNWAVKSGNNTVFSENLSIEHPLTQTDLHPERPCKTTQSWSGNISPRPTIVATYLPGYGYDPNHRMVETIEEKSGGETRVTTFNYIDDTSTPPKKILSGISHAGDQPWSATYGVDERLEIYIRGDLKIVNSYYDKGYKTDQLWKNKLISRRWKEYANPYEIHEIVATDLSVDAPGASSNLRTKIYLYPGDDTVNPWALAGVRFPDGTGLVAQYQVQGTSLLTTISRGAVAPGEDKPTNVSTGTRTEIVKAQGGGTLSAKTYMMPGNLQISGWAGSASNLLPGYGYPRDWTNLDGTTGSATYSVVGQVKTITDEAGKTTSYTYDVLGRPDQVTRDGITADYTFTSGESSLSLGTGKVAKITKDGFGEITKYQSSWDRFSSQLDKNANGYTATSTDALGNRVTTAELSPAGIVENSGGNAAEPAEQEIDTATIPGSGITGIKVTVAHAENSSLQEVSYYDGAGQLRRTQTPGADGNVAVTTYSYNDNNQLIGIADADGVVTRFEYDSTGEVNAVGKSIDSNPDLERFTKVVTEVADGGIQTSTYDSQLPNDGLAERKVVKPAQNRVEIYAGNSTSPTKTIVVTRQQGVETVTTSSELGTTTQTYTDGVLTSTSSTSGGITRGADITSDDFGQPTGIETNGSGPQVSLDFNEETGAISGGTFAGQSFSMLYGNRAGGGMSVDTYTSGDETTQTVFDGKNNLLEVDSAQNSFSLSAPSLSGQTVNKTLTVDGKLTIFSSNFGGGGLQKKLPGNSTTTQTFSAAGRLLTSTNARGKSTSFGWNEDGDLTSITPYGEPATLFTPRPQGGIQDITDASGKRTLGYDSKGRLSTITYSDGPLEGKTLTYFYDDDSRFAGVSVNGKGVRYGYDGSQITSVQLVEGSNVIRTGTFSGAALPSGLPKDLQYGALSMSKGVDSAGRINSIQNTTSAGSHNYGFLFNTNSKKEEVSLPGGKKWVLGYDGDHLHTATKQSGSTVLQQFTYVTDSFGNPETKTVDGVTTEYGVPENGLNQVKDKTNPVRAITVAGSVTPGASVLVNGAPQNVVNGKFLTVLGGFGGAAQWMAITVQARIAGGGDDGRDAVEQRGYYAWLPPQEESLVYDLDGNREQDSRFIYTWNHQNRLISIIERNVREGHPRLKVEFEYDSEGRRYQKTVSRGSSVQSRFLYVHDGWRLLFEEEYKGMNTLVATRSYTWGPDMTGTINGAAGVGGLLEISETRGGTTTRSIAISDGISVTALVDASSGEKVATYEYGPFGELLSAEGERVDSCPLRFSTKYYDREVGLSYFGRRYYDSETRSWISRDPLGEAAGLNLYAFCGNDPFNCIDPDGLSVMRAIFGTEDMGEFLKHWGATADTENDIYKAGNNAKDAFHAAGKGLGEGAAYIVDDPGRAYTQGAYAVGDAWWSVHKVLDTTADFYDRASVDPSVLSKAGNELLNAGEEYLSDPDRVGKDIINLAVNVELSLVGAKGTQMAVKASEKAAAYVSKTVTRVKLSIQSRKVVRTSGMKRPRRSEYGGTSIFDFGSEGGGALLDIPENIRFRIVRGDKKGRPFGTPRNPRAPTIAEFNPRILEIKAADLEQSITSRKHGLFVDQQQSISRMSNDDLLSFRPEDPISSAGVVGNLSLTGGHHRTAEIIRRVASGEIPPDAIVKILLHD